MKKIFIALLLSAITVCTWAQKDISFGANNSSTWKTTSNPKTLLINIDVADDLQKAGIGWNGVCDWGDLQQAEVTMTGKISFSDFVNVICKAGDENNFVNTRSLDMSEAQFDGSYDATELEQAKSDFKVRWDASYGHKNGNDIIGFLAFPGEAVVGANPHLSLKTTFAPNDACEIHTCGESCTHSLKDILSEAGITSENRFDLVRINLDNEVNKVTEGLAGINTYALDLTEVKKLYSWADVKNQYVSNVILPVTVGALYNEVKDNFDSEKLYNVIVAEKCDADGCHEVMIDAYINKPGYFANGLQYVSVLNPQLSSNPTWWNTGTPHNVNGYTYSAADLGKLRVSGYVFARDLKSTSEYNLTKEGHLRPVKEPYTYQDGYAYRPGACTSPKAPSLKDPNVIYFSPATGNQSVDFNNGALLGAHITHYDFTNAEFGEYVDGVFKYYPADMTLSELQYLGNDPSIEYIYLPKSPTQYVIPEGFIHDSKHIHYLCIPCNYTEIQRFAFLSAANNNQGDGGGINHYTTTAFKDGEQLGVLEGDTIDNGEKTMTLASTIKFVGRGAFSGYGGAAHIEDVYVLAEKAPICEFYAFDQKTYVGQDSHEQAHLIKKGNYVNPSNGMAMLHFPNTTNQREMLNYSDMTRHYRLYDETGKYDNVGNILVWPTQAQYNRSFNQALAGVTWYAWKENLEERDSEGKIVYECEKDKNGNIIYGEDGKPIYIYEKDDDGNIIKDENGNPIKIPVVVDNPEKAFAGGDNRNGGNPGWLAGSGDKNANHDAIFEMAAKADGFSEQFIDEFHRNPLKSFDGSELDGKGAVGMNVWDTDLINHSKGHEEDESYRPLSFDFENYGGWHQFTIAELYDFMLEKPGPDPDRKDYFNFARYNKNVWYAVCFPFNLTKAQFQKALGDPENGKYPYLSTLAGVTRDADKLKITVHMSSNLLENSIVYDENCPNTVKCDASTGFKEKYVPVEYDDDDIVVEANKPYFVLPNLPEKEILKATEMGSFYNRKSEITVVDIVDQDKVAFPVPLHVHAVNGTNSAFVTGVDSEAQDTTYAYNYYFVGNYIPQSMPENAYYVALTKKSNGSWWSSFFRMTPEKKNKTWAANSAIVMALIEDEANQSKSKGFLGSEEEVYEGKTHNYVWKAQPHNDWVFFEGTSKQAYTKNAFGMQVDSSSFTTSIQLPEDFKPSEDQKVYNLNGQYVGTTFGNIAKGIYIVGGKKVVVK